MLDLCATFPVNKNIILIFNHKKSFCLRIRNLVFEDVSRLSLGNMDFNWVKSIKYLGIMLSAGNALSVNIGYMKRCFYVSCHSVLNKCKYVNDDVKASSGENVLSAYAYILCCCFRSLWAEYQRPCCMLEWCMMYECCMYDVWMRLEKYFLITDRNRWKMYLFVNFLLNCCMTLWDGNFYHPQTIAGWLEPGCWIESSMP